MTNTKKQDKEKFKWNSLLFLALLLFGISLITGQAWLNIPAIILAFMVHRFGNQILFADYYERKQKSQERFERYRQKKDEE